jgi:hypothetical protein
LVVWVISYLPEKCTTVIVVNWAEIGRSMTDRKFRVQSSLFRTLCLDWIITQTSIKITSNAITPKIMEMCYGASDKKKSRSIMILEINLTAFFVPFFLDGKYINKYAQ